MAGSLEALLLNAGQSSREVALPTVPLAVASGLMLVPLTERIRASVVPGATDSPCVGGFYVLTTAVAEWARHYSREIDVAYLHTEFFGGGGFHAAVAWRAGAVAWGPLFTATSAVEAEDHYTVVTDRRDLAVNVMLRWWGVQRGDQADEFAATGLDRWQSTEEWAALAVR